MVSAQCEDISITLLWNTVVFWEEKFWVETTNRDLVGSVEHPISKACSLCAVVKNAVRLAVFAVWICRELVLTDDLSTTAFGIEHNKHIIYIEKKSRYFARLEMCKNVLKNIV